MDTNDAVAAAADDVGGGGAAAGVAPHRCFLHTVADILTTKAVSMGHGSVSLVPKLMANLDPDDVAAAAAFVAAVNAFLRCESCHRLCRW